MMEEIVAAGDDKPQDSTFFPHWFKLQHRAPLEVPNLSHIRKTLSPGGPVPPARPASFETVGQWLVCCAGASLTEDPLPHLR